MNTSDNKYAVHHNGKIAYFLSKDLAQRNNVSDDELTAIVKLHQRKLDLFDRAAATTGSLREHATELESIEYEMQRNWHFPLNRDFHEWYTLPGCSCPRMDNQEWRGTDRRIISSTCRAHGFSTTNADNK